MKQGVFGPSHQIRGWLKKDKTRSYSRRSQFEFKTRGIISFPDLFQIQSAHKISGDEIIRDSLEPKTMTRSGTAERVQKFSRDAIVYRGHRSFRTFSVPDLAQGDQVLKIQSGHFSINRSKIIFHSPSNIDVRAL